MTLKGATRGAQFFPVNLHTYAGTFRRTAIHFGKVTHAMRVVMFVSILLAPSYSRIISVYALPTCQNTKG